MSRGEGEWRSQDSKTSLRFHVSTCDWRRERVSGGSHREPGRGASREHVPARAAGLPDVRPPVSLPDTPRPRHTRQHARSTGHGARALLCEPDSKTSRLAVLRWDLRAPPRAKPVTAGPAPSRDPQWDGGRGTGTWASGADRALTRPIAATVQLSLRVCHVEMTVEAVSSQRGSGCVGSRLTPGLPRSPFRVATGVLSPETQFRCPLFPKALRLPPPATRPSGLPHPARSVIAAGWFTY